MSDPPRKKLSFSLFGFLKGEAEGIEAIVLLFVLGLVGFATAIAWRWH